MVPWANVRADQHLAEIAGLAKSSLQPAVTAQGEYAGLLIQHIMKLEAREYSVRKLLSLTLLMGQPC